MKENRGIHIPLTIMVLICVVAFSLIGYLLVKFAGSKPWFMVAGYLVGATVLAVAGCIAYHQLKTLQGTQRASVLISLDGVWMSEDVQTDRIEFNKFKNDVGVNQGDQQFEKVIREKMDDLQKRDIKKYRQIMRMVEFFEGVGYFCKMNYILLNDAFGFYGPAIRENNEFLRPHILDRQKRDNDKTIYCNFLWLADQLNKTDQASCKRTLS